MDLGLPLPVNRNVVHVSSWSHPKSHALDIIQGHPLNQQVEIFIPSFSRADVGNLAREESFYYSMTLTLRELVTECRTQSERRYYAILKNAPQDGSNTFALFPTGELMLSLDYETYSKFGLVGHEPKRPQGCKSLKGAHNRVHVVSIHIDKLDETTPFGQRVYECLDRFGPVELFICATNARGVAQTISITHDEAQRKRMELNSNIHGFNAIHIPVIQEVSASTHEMLQDKRQHIQDVHEWLGIVSCRLLGLLGSGHPEEYVSTYTGPTFSDKNPSSATSVQWRGLIPETFCHRMIDHAKSIVADGQAPWASVMVWGFPDTLASWWQNNSRRDHGYQLEGCNGYTIVFLPNDRYWIIQSVGAQDTTV